MNLNFDLNLYKTFYVVAKYNSFTKASEKLYISQPAITQAIKKLEDQLNVELFTRTGKGIALTKAGEIVYYYSEKLYELARANDKLVHTLKEASFEEISIGLPTHIGTFYFVKYFKEFNKMYPNVKINIVNKKSDEMMKMLIKRELDIVIDTDINNIEPKLIKTHKIQDLEGCFVCNSKFKHIADKEKVFPYELIDYPLILPGKVTSTRRVIDSYFQKQDIILTPLVEANSSSISKEIISQGIGIGWMIKDFILGDLEKKELFEVNVDIEKVITEVGVAYNKKFVNDVVKEFINLLK